MADYSSANSFRQIVIGAVIVIGLLILWSSFYTVNAGQRAIVLRFGQVESVVGDGLHFKAPMIETIKLVDVRTQKAESPANAGTRDLQSVETHVALNYHLNADSLADTYSRIGLDVESKIIDPRIQEVVKAVVARFSAEELLTKRDDVKSEIAGGLRASLLQYNITLEDIQITNFSFSHAFDAAIEAKQTAEQNALKAKNDLDRIKIEAQQKIAMAQAEAEAIKIQAQAIKEQGGSEYVQLKAIEKWNGVLPQVSGSSTPFVNLERGAR
ncbi:MAG TPA: prohibitin family protein [Steroidobacteraceae bacterium]|nr:prohibitin family protein [Steroidobacteraceae bacterium]